MIILNLFAKSLENPMYLLTNIKWSVEETGKNSVNPSTIPRKLQLDNHS